MVNRRARKDEVTTAEFQALARFRQALRTFLRFSEAAARDAGVTPAQHQLMVAIKGWTGDHPPSITDLAGTLLLRHHSTVELAARAEDAGLVVRHTDPRDGRRQQVVLTPLGEEKLGRLAALHREELRRFRQETIEDLLALG